MANTIQTGINRYTQGDITKYALFLGGTNVTNEALRQYDPLTTGYGRLFMVRTPLFLTEIIKDQLGRFKHILEYGNTAIQGINDITVNFNTYQGGYTNRSFEIPSYAEDGTNSFTVTVYEFSGSPVREVIHTWINGTTDLLSGLQHYNGAPTAKSQANHTAEFIYVATDRTGHNVEYACMFANCFPAQINIDPFNYTSGQHDLVETAIEFRCTKYESIQINKVAKALLNKHRILTNSLNFNSGIGSKLLNEDTATVYDTTSGKIEDATKSSSGGNPDIARNVDIDGKF